MAKIDMCMQVGEGMRDSARGNIINEVAPGAPVRVVMMPRIDTRVA